MKIFSSLYGVFLYNKKMDDSRQQQRQPIMVKRDFELGIFMSKQLDRTDHHASIVDISNSGVGIESNSPMEPGLVWFRHRIWGQHSGVLLWCKQVGTLYRSGIRFAPLPHDAELNTQNQVAQSGREPLKDLTQLVAMQLASIKAYPA
jgi:hypothetical protein